MDGQSVPTTRPAFAKRTLVKIENLKCRFKVFYKAILDFEQYPHPGE